MSAAARGARLSLVERLTIGIPLAWLLAFLAFPIAAVAALAIHPIQDSIPPVGALFTADGGHLQFHGTARALRMVFTDGLYLHAFTSALVNAALTALACVAIGFPFAYAIARAPAQRRNFYVLLAVLPFWTSFLLRAYAWIGMLRDSGPLNGALLTLGLIDRPLPILYSPAAVLLVMVYSYLPFFVLPMYAVLEKLPADLLAAAADLGARPWYVFRTVTVPLSLTGIASGAILVFVPALGEYVIPELVGNSDTLMIGGILWDEFFENRDWPLAATIALVTFGLLMLPALLLRRSLAQLGGFGR
jgi:putrescine transport system permease protein